MEKGHFQKVCSKLSEVSSSMCLAKWKQTTLSLYNGNTQSCHLVDAHRVDLESIQKNPETLHNTKENKVSQKQMLKGERPPECFNCWQIEDRHGMSQRFYKSAESWAWKYFEQVVIKDEKEDLNPSYLEVSFDPVCDLKCIHCGPIYSTAWRDEIRKNGGYPTDNQYNNMDFISEDIEAEKNVELYYEAFWRWWPNLLPSLEHFRVTGGEPLLSDHLWLIFEKLKSESKLNSLNFSINTGLGVKEKQVDKLIQEVNSLKGRVFSFTLFVSMDSVDHQAEYIRYGIKFDKFMENIEKILNQVNWSITVSYIITVNALSLPGLGSLLSDVLKLRKTYPQHHIGMDTPYLNYPEHLSLGILESNFRSYLTSIIEYMEYTKNKKVHFYKEEIQAVRDVLRQMELNLFNDSEKKRHQKNFYLMIEELDSRRGTNFLESFPEYVTFLNYCKKLS